MTQVPSLGRIVHYVLPNGPHRGESRAAIITGCSGLVCNLSVFLDQIDDFPTRTLASEVGTHRAWDVPHSETRDGGTWHWPPFVAPKPSMN